MAFGWLLTEPWAILGNDSINPDHINWAQCRFSLYLPAAFYSQVQLSSPSFGVYVLGWVLDTLRGCEYPFCCFPGVRQLMPGTALQSAMYTGVAMATINKVALLMATASAGAQLRDISQIRLADEQLELGRVILGRTALLVQQHQVGGPLLLTPRSQSSPTTGNKWWLLSDSIKPLPQFSQFTWLNPRTTMLRLFWLFLLKMGTLKLWRDTRP